MDEASDMKDAWVGSVIIGEHTGRGLDVRSSQPQGWAIRYQLRGKGR